MKKLNQKIMILVACIVIVFNGCAIKEKGIMEENSQESNKLPDNEVVGNPQMAFSNDINLDILSRHAYPALERMEKNDREELVESLQVIKKMERLNLDKNSFLYPELNLENAEQALEAVCAEEYTQTNQIDFEGTTSSELQAVIDTNENAVIHILSRQIDVTDAITLKNNIGIKGNGVKFSCIGTEYAFIGKDISGVLLENLEIDGDADYGIMIAGGRDISILNCTICNMKQKPICLIGEIKGFRLFGNTMIQNYAGGVYIAGDVSNGLVEENKITNNMGTSNWMAGIVLTNVLSADKLNIWETFDEAHHFPYKENLYAQLKCPQNIIIRNNEVSYNNASGIYSDGAYCCYVIDNTVRQNDKEGICLDYGTIGFYLKENIFDGNGRRIRQTDDDLRMDFVLEAGRMEDSSAKAKLPGVSLDNTIYNILENNIVIHNYGGGIKMVRTAVRNLISENIIRDNNMGQNDLYHFFGIEVGAALADVESGDMDFTPSFENIICRNSITGNHYSGVFIGENCYVNDVFDNVIIEPQMFAVESISTKFNSIVNNISNVGIRNEYQEN